MAANREASVSDAGWRERAVERSLRTARARAVSRSDRFIAAATELLYETGRTDSTVQEIVERSQLSLRSFYQHFGSKDELLLALFEEAVRDYVGRLRTEVDRFTDPVERLRTFVKGLYGSVDGVADPEIRALTVYHLQLAESHPREFATAIAPQTTLLAEIVEAGVASGQFRADLGSRPLTVILMQTLVSAVHMHVLGVNLTGDPVTADGLWTFCLGGVSAPTPPADP